MDQYLEPLDDNDAIAEQVGDALKTAQKSRKPVEDKLNALLRAEDLLLNKDNSGHLLDNFLDEMLEFGGSKDDRLKCFVASFIEKACKKDAEVMKKSIASLTFLLKPDSKGGVCVMKRVITVCANLYPVVLKWAVGQKNDSEAEKCWEAFCVLKGRIMQNIDTDNEGVRTMTFKFLESIVLAQSTKSEESEPGRGDLMSLNDISRNHRFISYRKMQAESNLTMQSLLNQTTITHISAQNLLTAVNVICTICRQRPEFLNLVLNALEVLHVNLPPTLGTSQVKSVRKELKMHLLRLLRHPSAISLHPRITTLLTDLGATQNEMTRAMPANLAELKRKARRSGSDVNLAKRPRQSLDGMGAGPSTSDPLAAVLDDEYAEEREVPEEQADTSRQSAVDITAQWVFERLNPTVVTNMVMISLVTLPDTIPPTFASSYTPIAAAGTEAQRRHLARMIATQATQMEVGPGVEQMRKEKLEAFNERQSARRDGAYIPPTPAIHQASTSSSSSRKPPVIPKGGFAAPELPELQQKAKVKFDLLNATRELSRQEMVELFHMAFQRVLNAERRAVQGGAGAVHNLVVVRLASRYDAIGGDNAVLESLVTEFIVAEHKARTDLALLWLSELYSQYQGFSFCFRNEHADGVASKDERLERYDRVMCGMLSVMFTREQHKEALFHKILLESPLVTSNALQWLKGACLDKTYGAFGMTTLRELILTRSRQRRELLQLLFELVFYDQPDTTLRQSCVETVKELCELSYLKDDVSAFLIEQLQFCALPQPQPYFLPHVANNMPELLVWDEAVMRVALVLYLAVLPMDPSLLLPLAETYADASKEFKRTVIRTVDTAIRAIGIHHPEMLRLVERCPIGAESLLARIVHLLTERNPVTKELMVRLKALHDERNTDVRSLIPVLNGLDKEDIIRILPQFVLKFANQKAVYSVFKKLLTGRNIDTGEPVLGGVDLMYEYHQIVPSTSDETDMQIQNLRELLDLLSKETIANSVDQLLDLRPLPVLFFSTLSAVYKKCPSLDGFLSNVVQKLISKELWQVDEATKRAFFRCLIHLRTIAFTPILTCFSADEFKQYVAYLTEKGVRSEVLRTLKDHLPSLSTHQLKSISSTVIDIVKEREERRERNNEEKERDNERDREREERREKERERDRGKREKERRDLRRSSVAV